MSVDSTSKRYRDPAIGRFPRIGAVDLANRQAPRLGPIENICEFEKWARNLPISTYTNSLILLNHAMSFDIVVTSLGRFFDPTRPNTRIAPNSSKNHCLRTYSCVVEEIESFSGLLRPHAWVGSSPACCVDCDCDHGLPFHLHETSRDRQSKFVRVCESNSWSHVDKIRLGLKSNHVENMARL